MFSVGGAIFLVIKTPFLSNSGHKQQWRLMNLVMMCSYHSSCIGFSVALVGCQAEGFS